MSHVSALETRVNDLDCLDRACKELGTVELIRNQKTYKWFGQWVQDYHGDDAAYKRGIDPKDYGKCEHAIRVKGNNQAYEVGVARNKDGELVLVYDFWAGGHGLQKAIGASGELLRREYALQCGIKTMLKKGLKVSREINPVTKKPRLRCVK